MIFTFIFTAEDDDDDNFRLNIDIDASSSFDDLSKSIQQSLGYKSDQLFTFQIPDERGNLEVEISPMIFEENDVNLPIDTELDYVYSLKGMLTMYVFDMINNRYLVMELSNIDENKTLSVPKTKVEGTAPPQSLQYNEKRNLSSSFLDDFENLKDLDDLGDDLEDLDDNVFDDDDDY
ncbi:MAG: hypothetical protein ACK5IQ_05110 [Bacteroidales bacterium]